MSYVNALHTIKSGSGRSVGVSSISNDLMVATRPKLCLKLLESKLEKLKIPDEEDVDEEEEDQKVH